MGNATDIEWADSTLNPWIGCTKVSPACDNCYAAVATPSRTLGVEWGAGRPRHRTSAANWKLPLRWNAQMFYACACGWRGQASECKSVPHPDDQMPCAGCPRCGSTGLAKARRRVFCASLADVFDNEVDPKWRADLFALIEATPNLDWLLLTKRIGNVEKMAPLPWIGGQVQHGPDTTNIHGGWPPNVWLGATICNQAEADRDVPKLLRVPAAVRFLSIEPMLGPIDLQYPESLYPDGPQMCCGGGFECGCNGQPIEPPMLYGINWIIAGGESGSHARPSNPQWFRDLRDQCAAAGVAYLHKQNGEWGSVSGVAGAGAHHTFPDGRTVRRVGKGPAGRMLDGVTHDGYPDQRSKV